MFDDVHRGRCMSALERPAVRPGLVAAPENRAGTHFVLWDRLRLSDAEVRLNALEVACLQLCDGSRTLRDLQMAVMAWTDGQIVPLELLQALMQRLDAALFLDGARFRDRAGGEVRAPTCIGCYEGEANALRRQLRRMFT